MASDTAELPQSSATSIQATARAAVAAGRLDIVELVCQFGGLGVQVAQLGKEGGRRLVLPPHRGVQLVHQLFEAL